MIDSGYCTVWHSVMESLLLLLTKDRCEGVGAIAADTSPGPPKRG